MSENRANKRQFTVHYKTKDGFFTQVQVEAQSLLGAAMLIINNVFMTTSDLDSVVAVVDDSFGEVQEV